MVSGNHSEWCLEGFETFSGRHMVEVEGAPTRGENTGPPREGRRSPREQRGLRMFCQNYPDPGVASVSAGGAGLSTTLISGPSGSQQAKRGTSVGGM